MADKDTSQIVDAMIERLRELQATGESDVAQRRVIAGAGLAGGGPLTGDVEVRLSDEAQASLRRAGDAVTTEDISRYTTRAQARMIAEEIVRTMGSRPRWTEIYTHSGALTEPVTSSPLVVVETKRLVRVGISARSAGRQATTVTIAGQQVTLPAGRLTYTAAASALLNAGESVSIELSASGARDVTVQLVYEDAR